MGPKILILSVLVGMGHIRAGQAIDDALRTISSKIETRCLDPLWSISPRISESLNRFYLSMIEPPWHYFWGFLYESDLLSSHFSPFRWFIASRYAKAIQVVLKEFRPDVIVSTHPFSTAGAGLLKRDGSINCPLVSCATDFDVHPFGICSEVDIFIVPHITIGEYLQRKGVSGDRIKTLGIPIIPKFSEVKDKGELKRRLRLREDTLTILLLSGGFGVGPIKEVVKSFKDFDRLIELMVVVGKGRVLEERLREIKHELKIAVKIFGYIENMDELMAASDLVITKPGGLSIAEALAKGLPLILLKPIKGQEVKNLNYLIRSGAAIYAKQIEEIPRIITHLISHPLRLELMRSRVKDLSRPNSAIEIGRVLIELANK